MMTDYRNKVLGLSILALLSGLSGNVKAKEISAMADSLYSAGIDSLKVLDSVFANPFEELSPREEKTLDSAIELFDKTLMQDPGYVSAWNFHALSLFLKATQSEVSETVRDSLLERTVEEYEHAFSLNDLGKLHMDLDEGNLMLDHRVSLARSYAILHDYEGAFEQTRTLRRFYPEEEKSRKIVELVSTARILELREEGISPKLGYAYLEAGFLRDAIDTVKGLLSRKPGKPSLEVIALLGEVRLEQGIREKAEGNTLQGLAYINEAVTALNRVLYSLDASDTLSIDGLSHEELIVSLGKANHEINDFVKAIKVLEPLSNNDKALLELANAYYKLGTYLLSGKVSEKVKQSYLINGIRIDEGAEYRRVGIELLHKVTELVPEDRFYQRVLERLEK